VKKCKKCIWADKRSGTKLYCPFHSCVMEIDIRARIIEAMKKRMVVLQVHIDRDYNGGLSGYNEAWREVKYWKEAIERGEFD
jgi:regulator of RNase E activity RraB